MTPAVIDQVRRNLAALDLSAENAQIIEIDRKLAENDDAKRRGQTELHEAAQSAREAREPDGHAAAEALLAGTTLDAMTAAKWQEKADQLRAGLRTLAVQHDDLYAAKKGVESKAAAKVQQALGPLFQAQRDAAQAAFDSLVSIRAAVECLYLARLADTDLRWDLERIVVRDLAGCMKRPASQQPTPQWIAAIAPDLAKLGPAFRRTAMPDSVQL